MGRGRGWVTERDCRPYLSRIPLPAAREPVTIADNVGDGSRRDFLRAGAAAGVGAALTRFGFPAAPRAAGGPLAPVATPLAPRRWAPMERVRIGIVGVGGQGTNHVDILLNVPGAEIVAVCDINEAHAERAARMCTAAGKPRPALYTRGPRDFERPCAEADVDLVLTATPWEWHVPVCVAAMTHGKHAATEVPAAYTPEGCWELVEVSERTGRHCVMLENCNYGRSELLVLNLVRQGVLGEVLHAEGAYLHDLRAVQHDDGEGLWRRAHQVTRNGNQYPTHGLGPVANCLDINWGDRFAYVVSMSGPARGLKAWQAEHLAAGDPRAAEAYVQGDVNVSLVKTANGKTIVVTHDVNLPRPYSRVHLVQGTRGLFMGYPDRVYVEGKSAKAHQWDDAKAWRDQYEHPLWRSEKIQQSRAGHGGMDYLEDYRLITCLLRGIEPDMTVHDGAALSALTWATERSVKKGSQPVEIPDYTRGRWKTTPAWPIVEA